MAIQGNVEVLKKDDGSAIFPVTLTEAIKDSGTDKTLKQVMSEFEAGVSSELAQTVKAVRGKLTYYVNPITGNDSNDGLTPLTAFKRITRASEITELLYNREDVSGFEIEIILASGDYTAESNVFGGSPFNGIRIQSAVMKSIELKCETPNGAILGHLTAFGCLILVIRNCVAKGVLHAKNRANITFIDGTLEGISLSDGDTKIIIEDNSGIWVHNTLVKNVHFLASCQSHSRLALSVVSGSCATLLVNYNSTGIVQVASNCTLTYTNLTFHSRPFILSEIIGAQQFPLPLASGITAVPGWANNYTKDSFGNVIVNLGITSGTNIGGSSTLGTLPAGFRPKGATVGVVAMCLRADNSSILGHLAIDSNGLIRIHLEIPDLRQVYGQVVFNIG